MKLSVVIPARNEEGCLSETLTTLSDALRSQHIQHEILVVDDGSDDHTFGIACALVSARPEVRVLQNQGRHGFGMAIRCGLVQAQGDAVAIMMADGSDSPEDLITYFRKMEEGVECVFGSRFIAGSRIIDYPKHKLWINRLANLFVRSLFRYRYNDTTNAFKMYRRHVLEAMQPLISPHFNLTVEMPLKAIVRGYTYAVVPISWQNRKAGESKLKIKEMGSRYLFIVLYLWLEKTLSRGDYHRKTVAVADNSAAGEPIAHA
ncbi:MAG: glycosyltransferase family 2 protein [Bryobacteraceae bacterium]